ncbi:MAG: hypothetical protein IH845_02530 [Nanoarchaeota archaeon]|nr:hypothetical protein [Nanoarchaeota archaeon]
MAAEVVSVSAIGYFLPIFAFLLVFIVMYSVLKKTGILGGSNPVMLFVSFILASFFILEASLVEFIQVSSAWFGVAVIFIFFMLITIAFMPWDNPFNFMMKNDWFSWAALGLILGIFVISSAYTFNFVVNWDFLDSWIDTDWFGFVLLIIIAGVVSAVVSKK